MLFIDFSIVFSLFVNCKQTGIFFQLSAYLLQVSSAIECLKVTLNKVVYHLWKPKLWKVRKWIFLVGQQTFSIGCYVSYFATFIIVTISCSLNNCSHEQKNEKLWNLLRETLQSRNGRPWLLPSSSTTSLKIFFILIFSFKISSLGLKDFIFSFLSYFGKFLLFFFCFVFILHHFFLSLIFRFSFIVCFRRFYFLFLFNFSEKYFLSYSISHPPYSSD